MRPSKFLLFIVFVFGFLNYCQAGTVILKNDAGKDVVIWDGSSTPAKLLATIKVGANFTVNDSLGGSYYVTYVGENNLFKALKVFDAKTDQTIVVKAPAPPPPATTPDSAGNLHAAFVNNTNSTLTVRVTCKVKKTTTNLVEIPAGNTVSFHWLGVEKKMLRDGELEIVNNPSKFGVKFNWAGGSDNKNASKTDWVEKLHRYSIVEKGTEGRLILEGPFTGN